MEASEGTVLDVEVDDELAAWVASFAAKHHLTVSQVLVWAVRRFMEQKAN